MKQYQRAVSALCTDAPQSCTTTELAVAPWGFRTWTTPFGLAVAPWGFRTWTTPFGYRVLNHRQCLPSRILYLVTVYACRDRAQNPPWPGSFWRLLVGGCGVIFNCRAPLTANVPLDRLPRAVPILCRLRFTSLVETRNQSRCARLDDCCGVDLRRSVGGLARRDRRRRPQPQNNEDANAGGCGNYSRFADARFPRSFLCRSRATASSVLT